MTRPAWVSASVLVLGLLFAVEPAAAQVRPRRPPPPPVGFRAYLLLENNTMAATKTFDAVLGTTNLGAIGGGGEVIRLWGGLFARFALASTSAHDGTRVAVFDGEAIPLGIPVTVEMRHTEYAAGWRFNDTPYRRLVPYIGASYIRLRYIEKSDFSDPGDNSDDWLNGFAVIAGVDVSLWKWLMAGGEVQFRTVPDGLGTAGASKAFNETDLGGAAVRVMVGIRR